MSTMQIELFDSPFNMAIHEPTVFSFTPSREIEKIGLAIDFRIQRPGAHMTIWATPPSRW